MLEPGRIISSETSSASTPGGIKRTVRANRAESEMEGLAAVLEAETRWDEAGFGAVECERGAVKERKRGEVLGERVGKKREVR